VEVKMNDKISERREGKRPSVKDLAAQLSATTSADLLLYAGPISMHGFVHLERCCKSRAVKRRNVVLFLSTYGGDTHAAYRIARCMGQHYTKFTILVHSVCKSAGTLLCLGANELVLSDEGELGPLDVQILKRNEIYDYGSGLDTMQTLNVLEERSMDTFRRHWIFMWGQA
jgi:membrane-bound ClpP family serine protease